MNHVVHVEQKSSASREQVFALLGDVTTWPSWSSFVGAELAGPGSPDPNGVGAIRVFTRKRGRTRERVVAYEAPSHFAYVLLEGLPIRDYRADVTLTATPEGGTLITWHSTFRGKWGLGWAIRQALTKFIAQTARQLADAAAREPAVP